MGLIPPCSAPTLASGLCVPRKQGLVESSFGNSNEEELNSK